jgi:hypothetical protein
MILPTLNDNLAVAAGLSPFCSVDRCRGTHGHLNHNFAASAIRKHKAAKSVRIIPSSGATWAHIPKFPEHFYCIMFLSVLHFPYRQEELPC